MQSTELIKSEVFHYQILSDRLKALYGEIDDETLRGTLEGISHLPDVIKEVVRSGLDDEALVTALKARVEDMQARLDRFRNRCFNHGHRALSVQPACSFGMPSTSTRHMRQAPTAAPRRGS